MVQLATRVASAGNVVFVPTYHSDLSTTEDLTQASDDVACAYQLARRTAHEYGGDLSQPVTAVGWCGAPTSSWASLAATTSSTAIRSVGSTK
jgi:hypothetical protein